jgi:hypothetical protein
MAIVKEVAPDGVLVTLRQGLPLVISTTVEYWSSLFYFLRGGKLRKCPYFIREVRSLPLPSMYPSLSP